jgi:cell division protein FtsB
MGNEMNRAEVKLVLDKITKDIESIADQHTKKMITSLFNLIELLVVENDQLKQENQKLRDENNRLKGEQGKPSIRRQAQSNKNFSSEDERRQRRNKEKQQRKSKKKKNRVKFDRIEYCDYDKSLLPADAIFKGHKSVIVQDIVIRTDNIKFKKAVYYSPSLRQTFLASLPLGYDGEFGPNIKALIISLYHKSKMTETTIFEFLKDHEIVIGQATVSRFITDNQEIFHAEKRDIVNAGLRSTLYQQMDDTGARVNGKNHYAHVLCNEFFTAYFTQPHKDRLTILNILTQGNMLFKFDDYAFSLMNKMKLPVKTIDQLKTLNIQTINQQEVDQLLLKLFPDPKKHYSNRQIILEASAISAYQQSPTAAKILLTDDAPQYNQITEEHALCWVHDARHYKKDLDPVVYLYRQQRDHFLNQYWDYYRKLLTYQKNPTKKEAELLEYEFDTLFSTKLDYEQLNQRIEKTKAKKNSLLVCLKYPETPLHNNASELGARDQARRRDVSFQTMNEKGTESKDTFMTITQTAKKLAVNSYHYIFDRVSKKFAMPSLASLIIQRSKPFILDTT